MPTDPNARLTLDQAKKLTTAELLDLPSDRRPLKANGEEISATGWRIRAGQLASDRTHSARMGGYRTPAKSSIKTELGPLTPPKTPQSEHSKSFDKLQLSPTRLKKIQEAESMARAMDITPAKIGANLTGIHAILGTLLKEPAYAIDAAEGQAMGEAIYVALIRYDMVWLFQHLPLATVIFTVGMVEFNTSRRVAEARARKRNPGFKPQVVPPPQAAPPRQAPGGGTIPQNGAVPDDLPFAHAPELRPEETSNAQDQN